MHYDTLRHFADSWGLVYLFAIFLAVAALMLRPGARDRARDAALIPLKNDEGNAP
ncbi:cbb3-type cytochrome c oxidase subunit 3 [Devosia oryziradicis]|uniref:Cbb3-type cytochrome c oxidase subunit 3 n=1 Tax=Devosia oryziradicis TaxID=2801335 RepID=A0ABX7BW83_9HYPH|nr:cbb3-type cytochrome c oxidase subunit 3 [Devosia oryziradicis]QQR36198.1 cbb3-type cytochrome c oxidase subunit 3 [Devosia oryziradicis]